MVGEGYCYRDVVPFAAMVAVECTNVGTNILFKAATLKGMSYYVFIVYSYALSTLFLLPLPFIFRRPTMLPPFNRSLFFKICLLGLIGVSSQILAYAGINYGSPTLASAMSNLTPAFTFVLAVSFRMEKLAPRSSSTRAKIMGTIVSISGAIIVVLYKGQKLISTPPSSSSIPLHQPLNSSQSNWVIGSLLLAAEYLLISIWYIVQTQIMKVYPAELLVVFLYNLCATIVSAPVCLIAETNLSAWIRRSDIAIIAIVYSGFFGTFFGVVIHTWGLRVKGPVYISMFKPLSIAIAAVVSAIFLGDSLYLGSVIGAIMISIGFYAVMWAKAKEEIGEDYGVGSLESSSNQKVPLLKSSKVEET